jgi:thymidylate synthase (FAD)
MAGRTAYKSEDKITESSYDSFIKNLILHGHEAVIEFGSMAVKFITDRGITHELVRHRLCSFVQESTRYCNYSLGKFNNEVTFIKPGGLGNSSRIDWAAECESAEIRYFKLLENGATPQQARAMLPNCTKAEIVVRANFREWRHIFKLRAISKAAHPDMRVLMIPLYKQCKDLLPCDFDMGEAE